MAKNKQQQQQQQGKKESKQQQQQVANRKQQKKKEKEEKEKMIVEEEEEEVEYIEEEVEEVEEEKDLPKNFVARLDKKHNVAGKFFLTAGAIIILPFFLMFVIYQVLVSPYVLEKPLKPDSAITYAGVTGIIATIAIQIGYMMMAIHESDGDKKEEEEEEKEEKKKN